MNLPEDDLNDFFAELRAEDDRYPTPSFTGLPGYEPSKKVRPLARYFGATATFFGAAATILLLVLLYLPGPDTTADPDPISVFVISLESWNDPGTTSLLSTPDPISSWESPSASLIADF